MGRREVKIQQRERKRERGLEPPPEQREGGRTVGRDRKIARASKERDVPPSARREAPSERMPPRARMPVVDRRPPCTRSGGGKLGRLGFPAKTAPSGGWGGGKGYVFIRFDQIRWLEPMI